MLPQGKHSDDTAHEDTDSGSFVATGLNSLPPVYTQITSVLLRISVVKAMVSRVLFGFISHLSQSHEGLHSSQRDDAIYPTFRCQDNIRYTFSETSF